ncbi:MAG: Cystathionine beta-synthase, partial [uncultured Acetobacteraceae bacterium]
EGRIAFSPDAPGRRWIRRRRRQDAADPPAPRVRGDGLRDSGQGGVHEPRRFGEGPRRARHHRGRRAARRPHPRPARHGGGGHGRQHRHRPDPGGERARLPLDHRGAGNPEPREDRLPPHDRRRPAADPCEALPRPRALRAFLPPHRRGDGGGRRAGDLGQPVRQPGQRPGARGGDGAGDLGRDRWPGGRFHLRLRHRRDARRRGAVPEGAEAGRPHRARRPDGQRALFLDQDGRGEGRGQLDHRGHRAGLERAGQPGGGSRRDRRRGAGGGPGGAGAGVRFAAARGAFGRRLGRHQRGGGGPGRARDGTRPYGGDDSLRRRGALPKQAVQPGIFAGARPAGAFLVGGV